MTLFEEAKAIARAGRPADAIAFIERAAASGDSEGNLIVAHWHLYGSDRPRDLEAAHRHLQAAAEGGSTHAVRIRANLTANGIGRDADPAEALAMLKRIAGADPVAAAQLALLPRMMSEADAGEAQRQRLSVDPSIELTRGLLLQEECDYLIGLAQPALKPSHIDDPGSFYGKADPIRTSYGASFLPHDEDLVVQAINRRIAIASRTSIGQAEALYVMRYVPGQEYKPHLDALNGLTNQRAWTAIAYLNDEYAGGATVFPQLSLSIRGGVGDLLIFKNVDSEGRPDARMRHAGEAVTKGEKWIGTRWIRSGPHDPYSRG